MQIHTPSQKDCIIIGNSIDAITTAVVLSTLGNTVILYADTIKLNSTIEQYRFEYQAQALWQMYVNNGQIKVTEQPTQPEDIVKLEPTQPVSLFWIFDDSLKNEIHDDTWVQKFVMAFNASAEQSTPIIFSGKNSLGYFSKLSRNIQRPWVYYIPFVFLQDGRAYNSMLNPSLWLVGEKTLNSVHRLVPLQPLQKQAMQAYVDDIETIEFARSSIMGMLATRVSYMNEMSRLADAHEVDITKISQIMGLDKRIGSSYLKAGWGFGGKTLPTELTVLQDSFENANTETQLISAVNAINVDQKELIFRKFWQYFDGLIEAKTVMIWGGGYKAGSGRTSESAIHALLRLLWSYNIKTKVCAAQATAELKKMYSHEANITFEDDPYTGIGNAHALFILNWDYEKIPEVNRINEVALPVFDAQNLFNTKQIKELTSDYIGIGRSSYKH